MAFWHETPYTEAKRLDCRNMDGPSAVQRTSKALASLKAGEVLQVVATDPGSVADMAAFSRRTKHELLDQSEDGGVYTFFFRKVEK